MEMGFGVCFPFEIAKGGCLLAFWLVDVLFLLRISFGLAFVDPSRLLFRRSDFFLCSFYRRISRSFCLRFWRSWATKVGRRRSSFKVRLRFRVGMAAALVVQSSRPGFFFLLYFPRFLGNWKDAIRLQLFLLCLPLASNLSLFYPCLFEFLGCPVISQRQSTSYIKSPCGAG